MTDCEIDKYIRTHGDYINHAVKTIKDRINKEEIDDVRQELYITMLKCLRNYNPEKKTPLDSYVIVSINRRASNIIRDKSNKKHGSGKFIYSLYDYIGNSAIVDMVVSTARQDELEDSEQIKEWMGKIDEPMRSVLWARASGFTTIEIGYNYGLSMRHIERIYNSGLSRLKEVALE